MTKFRLFAGDAKQRWYVEYYDENGKRKRIYDGVSYGLPKGGNQIKSIPERRQYFKNLFKLVQNQSTSSNDHQIKNGSITLQDAFKIVITAKEKQLKSRSIKILKRTANYLIKAVGNIPLEDCTSEVLIKYLDSLTIAPQSVNSIRRDLSTMFSYLQNIGILKINPILTIKKRKLITIKKNEAYTLDQVKQVFAACEKYSSNMYLIAALMYAAFLRGSEIIQLTGSMLDFENNRIVLPAYVRKTNDFFIIPMSEQLRMDLIKYEKHLVSANELVFSNNGKMLSEGYYSMSFLKIKKRYLSDWIGENQTLNSVRHTAAVHFFQKTNNLKKLSMLMGHTSIQTTIIYLRSLGKIVGDIEHSEMLEY